MRDEVTKMVMKSNSAGQKRRSGIIELIVLIVLPILLNYLFPLKVIITPPLSYLGIIVMIAGLGFMALAAKEFRSKKTGFKLKSGGTELVISGPFRFSRNPIYLGMVVWMSGLAVFLGSLVVFFFPVALFLLAHFVLIPIEEKKMEQVFGMNYLNYKKDIRRWV